MAGPLQKNLSRRVSFNEATLARAQEHHQWPPVEPEYIDTETQATGHPQCRTCCNSCCSWVSLVLAILLLLTLILGGMCFAFLQSSLPEVRVQRLDVYTLVVNNTDTDTFLTADFEVTLNATNQNGNIDLSYGPMTGSISSEGISIGTVSLPPLIQKANTSAVIKVQTAIQNVPVEEAAADDLKDNSLRRLLVVNVLIKGQMGFLTSGKTMKGFPFKVSCHSIDQSEIENGHAPKCSIQMSLL